MVELLEVPWQQRSFVGYWEFPLGEALGGVGGGIGGGRGRGRLSRVRYRRRWRKVGGGRKRGRCGGGGACNILSAVAKAG